MDCCNNRPSALFNGIDSVLGAFDFVKQFFSSSCWTLCVGTWIDKVCFKASYVYASTEIFALSIEDNLHHSG